LCTKSMQKIQDPGMFNLNAFNFSRLAGWWGHDPKTRFAMDNHFSPIPGAAGYQLSNPSVLSMVGIIASMQIYDLTSMEALRKRSVLLTRYLEMLLEKMNCDDVKIITPRDVKARGCQLSLLFPNHNVDTIMSNLQRHGVVCDARKPNVIRVAPAPLYNTFADVYKFASLLPGALSN
jgi:kynureninase